MAKCTGVVDEKKEGFLLNYSEISQEELKETIDNGFRQMGYRLKIMKATSGMSGGIIGMNQVKQEFKNLKATFQSI